MGFTRILLLLQFQLTSSLVAKPFPFRYNGTYWEGILCFHKYLSRDLAMLPESALRVRLEGSNIIFFKNMQALCTTNLWLYPHVEVSGSDVGAISLWLAGTRVYARVIQYKLNLWCAQVVNSETNIRLLPSSIFHTKICTSLIITSLFGQIEWQWIWLSDFLTLYNI